MPVCARAPTCDIWFQGQGTTKLVSVVEARSACGRGAPMEERKRKKLRTHGKRERPRASEDIALAPQQAG